jgi:hypothetical protein
MQSEYIICGSLDGIPRLYAKGSGCTPLVLRRQCDVTSAKEVRYPIECKTVSSANTEKERELLIDWK